MTDRTRSRFSFVCSIPKPSRKSVFIAGRLGSSMTRGTLSRWQSSRALAIACGDWYPWLSTQPHRRRLRCARSRSMYVESLPPL